MANMALKAGQAEMGLCAADAEVALTATSVIGV